MDDEHRKVLERQSYYITGKQSAVKICTWTKKSIKNEGVCYKEQFYGIRSHLCCQISTTVGYCQNSCLFCWRAMEYTETKEMEMPDDPDEIIDQSIYGQKRLLSGLGGYEGTDKERLKIAQEPMHFAISLTGEPFMYPKLGELICKLHDRDKTTFVVSNGMLPEKIESLSNFPTQLYLSVDAPNEELFYKIDNPSYKDDGWERLNKSLDVMKSIKDKTRTSLRFTLIKDMNMTDVEGWAKIIEKSEPMFVEIKAYMFVGFSRERLKIENMPRSNEVREFAEKVAEASGYKIVDEAPGSRVCLLMKEDFDGRIMKFD